MSFLANIEALDNAMQDVRESQEKADAVLLLGIIVIVIMILARIYHNGRRQTRLLEQQLHRQAPRPQVAPENVDPRFREIVDETEEGQFQVDGVDRETRMDTRWHCHAASNGNAKAKAELEGIVVTRVTRIG